MHNCIDYIYKTCGDRIHAKERQRRDAAPLPAMQTGTIYPAERRVSAAVDVYFRPGYDDITVHF